MTSPKLTSGGPGDEYGTCQTLTTSICPRTPLHGCFPKASYYLSLPGPCSALPVGFASSVDSAQLPVREEGQGCVALRQGQRPHGLALCSQPETS